MSEPTKAQILEALELLTDALNVSDDLAEVSGASLAYELNLKPVPEEKDRFFTHGGSKSAAGVARYGLRLLADGIKQALKLRDETQEATPLNDFVRELTEIVNLGADAKGSTVNEIELETGPKYTRVIVARRVKESKESKETVSRSAYAFIENETGNLFKPAGWKGPTKNVIRGNIKDGSWKSWCGTYGIGSAK